MSFPLPLAPGYPVAYATGSLVPWRLAPGPWPPVSLDRGRPLRA